MKTVLITGASSGIGYEFAKIFAQKHYHCIIVARNKEKLEQVHNELKNTYHNVPVTVIVQDLSEPQSAQKVLDKVKEHELVVDVLINNAGFGDTKIFHEANLEKLQQMIHLNITTLTDLTRLVLPHMVHRNKGYILNVASTAAFQPGPYMATYFATKAYVLSLTEAIADELRDTNIGITALCPGATRTGFQDAANLDTKAVQGSLPSAAEVAEYGYNALMNKKVVAIHGWKNWLTAFSVRFAPRKLVTALVRKLFTKN